MWNNGWDNKLLDFFEWQTAWQLKCFASTLLLAQTLLASMMLIELERLRTLTLGHFCCALALMLLAWTVLLIARMLALVIDARCLEIGCLVAPLLAQTLLLSEMLLLARCLVAWTIGCLFAATLASMLLLLALMLLTQIECQSSLECLLASILWLLGCLDVWLPQRLLGCFCSLRCHAACS